MVTLGQLILLSNTQSQFKPGNLKLVYAQEQRKLINNLNKTCIVQLLRVPANICYYLNGEPFTCTEFALLGEFSPECHALKSRWKFNLYVM